MTTLQRGLKKKKKRKNCLFLSSNFRELRVKDCCTAFWIALLSHSGFCQAKALRWVVRRALAPLHPDTVEATSPFRLGTRAAFFFPLELTEVLQREWKTFQWLQQGFGSGSFTKHCSITALRPEVIFKRSSGSCPLNTLGFGFAFNAHSILSELSPIEWRACIPLPQEYLKGSVFT